MEIVWKRGVVTVRDVHVEAGKRRALAYTTVGTTMTRLSRKGLLECIPRSHAHSFKPAVAREEYARHLAGSVLGWLLTHFPKQATTYFIDRIGDDLTAIEQLRREIAIRSRSSENVAGPTMRSGNGETDS
jgi:predicted transcriptional regulator